MELRSDGDTHAESGALPRLRQWLTPLDDGPQAQVRLRRGHHRLQIAVDTIANAHNIPLRLLLTDRLRDLPVVIRGVVDDPGVRAVLRQELREVADSQWPSLFEALADARLWHRARRWLLQLASRGEMPPAELPGLWLQSALTLLPYVERKVWLTEMGNPLPAHALCRMQDHWALYVLMWTWDSADLLARERNRIDDVFGVPGLVVHTMHHFTQLRPDGDLQGCMPVAGPYFVGDDNLEADAPLQHERFCDRFGEFVRNIVDIDHRNARAHTVPLRDELMDALAMRIGLTPTEANLRIATSSRSLDLLFNAEIDDLGFLDGTIRADWETLAALCAWLARWKNALLPHLRPDEVLVLWHGDDPVALRVARDAAAPEGRAAALRLGVIARSHPPHNALKLPELLKRAERNKLGRAVPDRHHRGMPGVGDVADGGDERDAWRIDRPNRYVNRIRERQNATWSSLVIAINNLLVRHGPREVYIGNDEFEREVEPGREEVRRDGAQHLLRGFGGSICRYLANMTRADAATIYWLDYAQSPPRLLPVGDYERRPEHRAASHAIWEGFDGWAWQPGPGLDNRSESNRRCESLSQAYRVAATAHEDPSSAPGEPYAAPVAYYDSFPEPRPVDSMAAPLMVSGRVIGVVNLLGLVRGQFDDRLFWPLRRAGQLAAACMNHQSQVWHMRRLNYLFARRGAHDFRRRDISNEFNPLRDVSRCLANIFLCPAAHIWLQSSSNAKRLELYGHNWKDVFVLPGIDSQAAREFAYVPPTDGGPGAPMEALTRPFASMAIDLYRDATADQPNLGRFVQGHFDPAEERTLGYDAASASSRGSLLARDLFDSGAGVSKVTAAARHRIFGTDPAGGYGLRDVMSFALIGPDNGGWNSVGVVNLHDKGDVRRDALRRTQPWDRGWSSVVAHMQTYLPYLFRQAEVLNNPEVDARRYLIHAGRAELLGVLDTMQRLRSKLESSLAPGRGVRQMLDKVFSASFAGDYRQELAAAQYTVSEAWEVVDTAASPVWENNLRQLANVMHEYRTLTGLNGISLDARTERIRLRELIEESVKRFAHQLRHKSGSHIDIPAALEVEMPRLWLRIVLRDLIHNIAKYSINEVFDISWHRDKRQLLLANESSYASDLDTPELLTASRGRGSAGERRSEEHARGIDKHSDGRGQGLGLWGAKLMCGVMNIGLSLEVKPHSANLRVDERGVHRGTARYIVRLVFPRGVVVSSAPVNSRDFY